MNQIGSLWKERSNEQSRKKPGKMNHLIYSRNNMSKHSWNQRLSVPENIEEEKESNKEIENQIESNKKILQLVASSGFEIGQINGQRKLGPPPDWTGPAPDPQCEVFVGKIPRDLYENEIYPVFLKIGKIYEIRLMMDFSGNNRGYCFVMYTEIEHAKRAIAELNNHEIRPGNKIGVVASINNCRLCVSHLPPNLNVEEFIKKIYETTDEVSKVSMIRYQNGRLKNAIISYRTHIGAAMARRRLVPDRNNFFKGTEIAVDWASPNLTFQNFIEESGVLDENGKVVMTKTSLNINKRGRKNSTRSEYSKEDELFNGKDKETENKGEESGRSSRNSMRSVYSGHQRKGTFPKYRNPAMKQRAMSEMDLRNIDSSLRPISKPSMPPRLRFYSSRNNISNNLNKNASNFRSTSDLSKTSFNHRNYPKTFNTFNRSFLDQDRNQKAPVNDRFMYSSNPVISASMQNLASNNIGFESSFLTNSNSQSSLLRDRFSYNGYGSSSMMNLNTESCLSRDGFTNNRIGSNSMMNLNTGSYLLSDRFINNRSGSSTSMSSTTQSSSLKDSFNSYGFGSSVSTNLNTQSSLLRDRFSYNGYRSSSMMNLNTESCLSRDGFNRNNNSVENLSSFWNKCLNVEPGSNYAGNGFLNSIISNEFNNNYGLISNGNNLYDRSTNRNSCIQPNYSTYSWNVGQQNNFERMNKPMHFEATNNLSNLSNYNQMPNYYLGANNLSPYYNAIPMPLDNAASFNDNHSKNNQNVLNNINGNNSFYNIYNGGNIQKTTLNNIPCAPKYDTNSCGIDKTQSNFSSRRCPRPILNRNFSENVK